MTILHVLMRHLASERMQRFASSGHWSSAVPLVGQLSWDSGHCLSDENN